MPKCDILTSSPRANSFYQAGRFKKFIPALYRLNAIELLKSNRKYGNIKVHEYSFGDWTFHAKGAWIFEESKDAASEDHGGSGDNPLPSLTIIGSSNFSHRSNRLDQEAQLYIAPSEQAVEFKYRVGRECRQLF